MVTAPNQTMTWGSHRLHKIWQKILPEDVLAQTPPIETKANCMACPKVQSDGFRPGVKCCTYHPKVPNYLLGFALDSASKGKVESLIEGGFLLPEGSGHTPMQWLDVMRLDQSKEYGRSSEVVCGFLDQSSGLCGIYDFRNSACSTYFCMYDQPYGETFWETLHHFMGRAELALIQIAMKKVGFDVEGYLDRYDQLSKFTPADLCDIERKNWKKEFLKVLWAEYFGKEKEFFRLCAAKIGELEDLPTLINREVLIRPNLLEISSLEKHSVESEEELIPMEELSNKLTGFMKRISRRQKT